MEDTRPPLLDPAALRQLMRRLEETGVDELEVVRGSSRLYLRREAGRRALTGTHGASTGRPGSVPGQPVPAPLTGVVYLRPSPTESPFVSIGDSVEAGQVVALVETMKLFNEVTAEFAGEVLSITVQEGALVEVGHPLMYLRPREGSEEI